jgi:hypothetical protein
MEARNTRADWARRVKRLAESGLDVDEFAAREHVTKRQLMWWRWRLARDGDDVGAAAHSVPFIELKTFEERKACPPLEVALRSGVVVRVADGFDAATLLRVVELLDGGAR